MVIITLISALFTIVSILVAIVLSKDQFFEMRECRIVKWRSVKVVLKKNKYDSVKYLGEKNEIADKVLEILNEVRNRKIYIGPPKEEVDIQGSCHHPFHQQTNILLLETNKKKKMMYILVDNNEDDLDLSKIIRIKDPKIIYNYEHTFTELTRNISNPETRFIGQAEAIKQCYDGYTDFYIKSNEKAKFLLKLPTPNCGDEYRKSLTNLLFNEWESAMVGSYPDYNGGYLRDTRYLFITWCLKASELGIAIQKQYIDKMQHLLKKLRERSKGDLIIDRIFFLDISRLGDEYYRNFIKEILNEYIVDPNTGFPPDNYRVKFLSQEPSNEFLHDIAIFSSNDNIHELALGAVLPYKNGNEYSHLQYSEEHTNAFIKLYFTESSNAINEIIVRVRSKFEGLNDKLIALSDIGIEDSSNVYNRRFI